jgi:serine/threonine-protein kinase
VATGKFIDWVDSFGPKAIGSYQITGYHWAFVMSTLLRIGALSLSRRLTEDHGASWKELLRAALSWKAFAVARQASKLQLSESEFERYRATVKLGRYRTPLAIPALVKALSDSSLVVRKGAIDALAVIGSPEVVEHLAAALFDTKSELHARAAHALSRLGQPRSLRALLKGLQASDPRVLRVTIKSLARLREPAALVPLISLYHEVSGESVRALIADALAKIAGVPSVEEVYHAMELGPVAVH